MRLIDADALRVEVARRTWGPYDPYAGIDSAPTVACRNCEHLRTHAVGKPHEYHLCSLGCSAGYDAAIPAGFGCVYFERRD